MKAQNKILNRHNARGFTLIELMFVVATIGLIASISIPEFSAYRERSRISEGLTMIKNIQLDIGEYYAHYGRFPRDNKALGLPVPEQLVGSNVDRIELKDGALHIRFQDKGDGSSLLSLRPALAATDYGNSSVSWVCGYSKAVAGMKVYGENRTDIQQSILPVVCW